MDSDVPIVVLDDLCSRFIINVPKEERNNLIRICFQIELAHWFYIDFYSKPKENARSCSLKEFATNVFNHVPFLHPFVAKVDNIIDEWKIYKYSVPTYGAILLNEDLSHTLLVQSYCSKSSWGFPKGKINKGESPWQCAIREVLEETGFDIQSYMDPTEYVEAVINEHTVRLYVVPGISMDHEFVPKTRNEIKSANWFPLADLPATKKEATTKYKTMSGTVSFFMVIPFVKKLHEWIRSGKKERSKRPRNKSCGDLDYLEFKDCINPTPDKKKGGKKTSLEKDIVKEDQGGDTPNRKNAPFESSVASGSNMLPSEVDVKVRRTLEYVMCQNPSISSPPVAFQSSADFGSNRKTPKQIRILKKTDNRTPETRASGKTLLTSLFSNKDLTLSSVGDQLSPNLRSDSTKHKTKNPDALSVIKDQGGAKPGDKIPESPQSKSFTNINHDRALSSFARVSHKGGARNYVLSHTPAIDSHSKADEETWGSKRSSDVDDRVILKFVDIPFSRSFNKHGIKAWSNFKFDKQDINKRMNG